MEWKVREVLERGKMDRDKIKIVGIDSLVPEEHLLRKIDRTVDFNRPRRAACLAARLFAGCHILTFFLNQVFI